MKTPVKQKQLNELTLLDRFLFASVMEDDRSLELVLSIIMSEEITLRQPSQVEKEFRTMPWLRSIRLDVYNVDDKNRIYDAEVQEKNTGNLAKRSRFYPVSYTHLPVTTAMLFAPAAPVAPGPEERGIAQTAIRPKDSVMAGVVTGSHLAPVFRAEEAPSPAAAVPRAVDEPKGNVMAEVVRRVASKL